MYPRLKPKSKISALLQSDSILFHVQDLATLWDISNKNTLKITIKRYVKKGLLFWVAKGLYSTKEPSSINPLLLGTVALHRFSYISCETVFQNHGLINPLILETTLVSSLSKRFSILGKRYRSRQINDKFLFNPAGIFVENGINVATKERAIADMLYFNPKFHFDGKVDWSAVKKIQIELHYPLTTSRYVDSKA